MYCTNQSHAVFKLFILVAYGTKVTIQPTANLMWFETNVGTSFKCNISQPQEVTNTPGMSLSVNFTMSQWEAFGINKSGEYNQRK